MTRTTQIPASGLVVSENLGTYKFLFIQSTTVPFQISFDGNVWADSQASKYYDLSATIQTRVFFRAVAGLPATINFQYANAPFQVQTTAELVADTFALGNGGHYGAQALNIAKKVGGGNWDFVSGVQGDIAAAGGIHCLGINQGRKRKQITFIFGDVTFGGGAGSAYPLVIFDASGAPFFLCKQTYTPFSFETSSDLHFYTVGAGLAAKNFIYNEIFYENP